MLGELLAVVGCQRVDDPAQPAETAQDGVAHVLGSAVRRVGQQVQAAAALGHGDHHRLATGSAHGVQFPIANALAGFHDGGPFRPRATVQQLATTIAQAASFSACEAC